jgi:flavodoxin
MKSNIVISIKDSGSVCTFSVKNGIIRPITSGGCEPAYVCRRAGAVLTGTIDEILASVEAAFNRDQCTVEDDLYRANLVETINAQIIEAGNGLPYVGDLVYSGDTNMVYRVATCSRVWSGGLGRGNSVEVTLIEAGSPDDYTETAFSDILDCQVDLEEEIDYSEYTVFVSEEPSYYGSECTQDDADAISEKLCEMIQREFPGIQTDLWTDGDGSSKTTGPDDDTRDEINEWISSNWTAAL